MSPTIDESHPSTNDDAGMPWWVFLLFGVLAVAIAVAVFAYTSRCPCKADPSRKVSFVEPEATMPDENKPFVDEASLRSTMYVLSWMGDSAPTDALQLHFLLSSEPYHVYSCTARGVFGLNGRVRITLPKGSYAVRAVFGDGTQAVAHDVPAGALVTFTETTLKTEVVDGPLAAAEVPTGVCAKVDERR